MFFKSGRTVLKSRSNNRTVTVPASEDRLIATDALLATYGGGVITNHVESESIGYSVRNPARPGAANFCVHKHVYEDYLYTGPLIQKFQTAASPTKYSRYTGYVSWSKTAHAYAQAAADAAFNTQIEGGYLASNGKSLIALGYEEMKPDLTEVSVPNFLLDIGQVTSLFRLWSKRRSVISNVAGANLNYNFGWKPTIGDVQGIIGAVTGFHDKIKAWNDSIGTVVTKRTTMYRNSVSKSGTLSATPFSTGTTGWQGNLTQTVTAHIAYRPQPIREMVELEKKIRYYMDSLGFELNPAIVWDKIPFSFVLDWFFPIGTLLESIKIDTLALPFVLVDSYLQYKETRFVSSWVRDAGNSNYQPLTYPGSGSLVKYFQRYPILPEMANLLSLGWKLPNFKQIGYALSLGLNR